MKEMEMTELKEREKNLNDAGDGDGDDGGDEALVSRDDLRSEK
jgi:hypothetical protein